MSDINLLDLPELTLENIVKALPITDQCSVARSSYRLKEICIVVWRRKEIYKDTIKYELGSMGSENYKYFICAMAEHLTTLALPTTAITAFSDTIEDMTLPKLTALRLDYVDSDADLPPINFLPKFINLKEIILIVFLLEFYLDDILGVETMKRLEVMRCFLNGDILTQKVINIKETDITKLHCNLNFFPPCWLTRERTFPNLEELGFETFHACRPLNLPELPILHRLKVLYLYGWNYSTHDMVDFVERCPNLERIIVYEGKNIGIIMSNRLGDTTYNFVRHEQDIVEIRKKTCNTPFDIPEPLNYLTKFRTEFSFI